MEWLSPDGGRMESRTADVQGWNQRGIRNYILPSSLNRKWVLPWMCREWIPKCWLQEDREFPTLNAPGWASRGCLLWVLQRMTTPSLSMPNHFQTLPSPGEAMHTLMCCLILHWKKRMQQLEIFELLLKTAEIVLWWTSTSRPAQRFPEEI